MRYFKLDVFRGITLISMVLYHMIWDLVYLFQVDIIWYHSRFVYIWQQSICWSFILLSGFCWSLGKRKLKRGFWILGSGLLITIVTIIFMPAQRVIFGVLTLLGSSMLLLIPFENIMLKVPVYIGLTINIFLFALTKNINQGFIGFGSAKIWDIPQSWYTNWITTFFGFPMRDFYSTDYFSLFPWIFLFLTGYFIYRLMKERDLLKFLADGKYSLLGKIGKQSLIIYIVHQPLLYIGLSIVF